MEQKETPKKPKTKRHMKSQNKTRKKQNRSKTRHTKKRILKSIHKKRTLHTKKEPKRKRRGKLMKGGIGMGDVSSLLSLFGTTKNSECVKEASANNEGEQISNEKLNNALDKNLGEFAASFIRDPAYMHYNAFANTGAELFGNLAEDVLNQVINCPDSQTSSSEKCHIETIMEECFILALQEGINQITWEKSKFLVHKEPTKDSDSKQESKSNIDDGKDNGTDKQQDEDRYNAIQIYQKHLGGTKDPNFMMMMGFFGEPQMEKVLQMVLVPPIETMDGEEEKGPEQTMDKIIDDFINGNQQEYKKRIQDDVQSYLNNILPEDAAEKFKTVPFEKEKTEEKEEKEESTTANIGIFNPLAVMGKWVNKK